LQDIENLYIFKVSINLF